MEQLSPLDSTSPEVQGIKKFVQGKKQQRASYADARRKPAQCSRFKVGDWVNQPAGPIRRMVSHLK